MLKKSIALVLMLSLAALATPTRPAHADDNTGTYIGLTMLGVGLLGVGLMAAAFSGKNFEGHAQNERHPDGPMVAKNVLDQSLQGAFKGPSEGPRPAAEGELQASKVVVAPSLGYDPATHTGAAGVAGVF